MTVDPGLLGRIRSRGEEILTQVSGELMSNPRFMKAMERAVQGKERLEDAVGKVLKQMNVPTRTELKRAVSRIDTLEREVAALKAKAGARAAAPRKAAAGKAAAGRAAARKPRAKAAPAG